MALRTSGHITCLTILIAALWLGPVAATQENPAAQEPFEQGVTALTQGHPGQAVEKFTAALKVDPEMVEAYINRGIAQMQLDQWVDAVDDFDKALELAPKSPEAYYNRGLAYSRQGIPDKALADYTKALTYAPKDWQIYYNRGNTYLDLNQPRKALQDYNQALKLHPRPRRFSTTAAWPGWRWGSRSRPWLTPTRR